MPLSSWSAVLDWHCQRYPLLQAQDIYKLVHQGVFGPGHMIASAAAARRSLAGEFRSQKAECRRQNRRAEELIEAIDPTGKLVRVNLRPLAAARCKAQSVGCKIQDPGWLVAAIVESARRVKGDPEQMRRGLAAAIGWCRENRPLQTGELTKIAVETGAAGLPALHHSPAYAQAYRPAYRVILRSCLDPRLRSSQKAGRSEKSEARS